MNSEKMLRRYKKNRLSRNEAIQLIRHEHRYAIRNVAGHYARAYQVGMDEAGTDVLHAAWELLEKWDPTRCPTFKQFLSNSHLLRQAINHGREIRGLKRKGNVWHAPIFLEEGTNDDTLQLRPVEHYSTINDGDLMRLVPEGDEIKKDLFEGFTTEGRYKVALRQTQERFPEIPRKQIRKSAFELRRDLAHLIQKSYPALAAGRKHGNKHWPRKLTLKRKTA